jgi:hypothetical protein
MLWLAWLQPGAHFLSAQVVLNEILFNPPGTDIPNEYLEIRGAPHEELPPGTFLVVVEGDTNGNPGVIQNIFDLSRRCLGGNGFLVLLQKTNSYSVRPGAAVLANQDDGEGFGSGSSSSIGHQGESGQPDLENGSATFFLVLAPRLPVLGTDIDSNNDGVPDGEVFSQWTILDSIGVLDNDGLGDIAYGAINFRRNDQATATGTIVPISFTADYLGRTGNTFGSSPADWVATGSLEGIAPDWRLGDPTDTRPAEYFDRPLDHIGGPNFGAPDLPGVLIIETDWVTEVAEAGGTDNYALALNTPPVGAVLIELQTDGQTEISTNDGVTFQRSAVLAFSSTTPVTITVRAVDDVSVEPSPHRSRISHTIVATGDPVQYPTDTPPADLIARVQDNDLVLLSELKVNPPGPNDAPFEFIEIRGLPNAPLRNVLVVAVEGDQSADPGEASAVFDLTGSQLGGNGLLLIVGANHPYAVAPPTTVWLAPQLSGPEGGLGNGSISFLLLTSAEPILEGTDLDKGNNGTLEGLPPGSTLLDAVGWVNSDTNDLVYGGVELILPNGTPDAATRLPNNNTPLSAPAWFAGNLLGDNGDSLIYDPRHSVNFPPGTTLTPGRLNNTAPAISRLPALCGAISDPTNPNQEFYVQDAESLPAGLSIIAVSDNAAVVPNTNLTIIPRGNEQYSLRLDPVGVGYATITILVSDGEMTGFGSFDYAASAAGYPDSRYHTTVTDASAAIALSPELMLVGDDENQVIRLYQRHVSGPPLAGFDMTPFLALTDYESGVPHEVDIEGATRVGNRLYWIGSQSHAEIGEIRTNRSRIFATDLSGSGPDVSLTYVGHYEFLKDDLIAWDQSNGHGKGADYYGLAASAADGVIPKDPYGRGFNVEGLTMAPASTQTAWVCFRAPIVPAANRLYALIVPVTNFATLASSGGPRGSARFGQPIELDLQGRGFRSIEGDTNGYLIVAGPPANIPTPFPPSDIKFYTWSGQPTDPPQQHGADLTGLIPEAIVELPPHPWTDDSRIQILSDDGRTIFYNDGIPGKQLKEPNFKKFRSDVLALGPVVRPQPFFTQINLSNQVAYLAWRSNPGDTCRLQFKHSLADFQWTSLPPDTVASEPITRRAEILNGEKQRFFQVVLLP